MGEVPDEVERGTDAEAGERIGPLLAHTLEELDRGVGAERRSAGDYSNPSA